MQLKEISHAKLELVDRRGGLVVDHLREGCPAASAWRENVRKRTLPAGVSGRAARWCVTECEGRRAFVAGERTEGS